MSESTTDTAQAPVFKMTIADTVKTLQTYLGQADSSLANLQSTIDDLTSKTNEAKRMQLILIGQKQLILDLLNKTVEAPKVEEKSESTK
jgi:hypothetical protein